MQTALRTRKTHGGPIGDALARRWVGVTGRMGSRVRVVPARMAGFLLRLGAGALARPFERMSERGVANAEEALADEREIQRLIEA